MLFSHIILKNRNHYRHVFDMRYRQFNEGPHLLERLSEFELKNTMPEMAKLIIEQALKRRQLSKRQFSKRIGVEYKNVFRLFRSGYNPTFKTLVKFAKAIGCGVRDLIKE